MDFFWNDHNFLLAATTDAQITDFNAVLNRLKTDDNSDGKNNIKIGSQEGTYRSYAIYDYIRVVQVTPTPVVTP